MESVIEFKLPALGENIEQGDLVRLMVAPGATVSEGQSVMELETDKAVVEVPSSVSGTVKEVLVKEGDKIKVGQVIFTADNNGASAPEKKSEKKESASRIEPGRNEPAPAAAKPQAAQSAAAPAAKPQSAPAEQAESRPERRSRSTDAATSTEFRLQELGENISEGDLVRLMIVPGAKVSEGQPVMELETDKAVVEVPSTVS